MAGGVGDISFGSAAADGPITSYAAELNANVGCVECTVNWPAGAEVFELPESSDEFRIGWGEAGPQSEGWYPWWSGTIRVR